MNYLIHNFDTSVWIWVLDSQIKRIEHDITINTITLVFNSLNKIIIPSFHPKDIPKLNKRMCLL